MSSFFGALIRSSAMQVGAPDSVRQAPSASAEGLVEIHEEREATPPVSSRAMSPVQQVSPVPPASERGPVARSTDDTRDRPVSHESPASAPIAPRVAQPAEASPPPASRVIPSPPTPAPVARQDDRASRADVTVPDPVRLAMQWIAADPETRAAAGLPRAETPAPAVTLREESSEAVAPHVAPREPAPPAIDTTRSATSLRQPAVRTIAPLAPVPLAPEPLAATAAPAVRDMYRHTDEETLEISIGAIHLHVEAPAPRTVVQPAPRQEAASRRRPERSSLHRRYLRSF